MKKFYLLLIITSFFISSFAQNVGITNDGIPPDQSAMLEVRHPNKGLLIPRVRLLGTNDVTTIPSPATSLLVYNTSTTGGATAVNPGFYYWNEEKWVMLVADAANSSAWRITGNAGTVDGTNFIGTTDNVPFNIRVNNEKAGSIDHLKYNTFWGYHAGNANTTGNYNTGTGFNALLNNSTGSNNTANGFSTLRSNTTGGNNVANGWYAMNDNTTGSSNTAVGSYTLVANTGGTQNTAIGSAVLYKNTTGFNNTALGSASLNDNTTGSGNVATGAFAMQTNATGDNNTAIGYLSLSGNISGNNNTALGYGANVSGGALTNATAIGANAIVNASNKVRIGNTAVTVIEGQVAYSFPSDARFKYNIKDNVPGLDFIQRLKPVTYYFDKEKLEHFTKTGIVDNNDVRSAAYKGELVVHTGFLAQDVERTAKELGYSFDGVHAPANNKDHYSLAYSQFIMPLVKAVQELAARNVKLEEHVGGQQQIINEQKKENDLQNKDIELLKKQVEQLTEAIKKTK
jgi:hypothetical protein